MVVTDKHYRLILQRIASRVMIARGLLPEFSKEALSELDAIHSPAIADSAQVRDLRSLLWCSIDNDDSKDLDQLTTAEKMPDGSTKILIAVADVDAVVRNGSAARRGRFLSIMRITPDTRGRKR